MFFEYFLKHKVRNSTGSDVTLLSDGIYGLINVAISSSVDQVRRWGLALSIVPN
jgi:hypothetical protein